MKQFILIYFCEAKLDKTLSHKRQKIESSSSDDPLGTTNQRCNPTSHSPLIFRPTSLHSRTPQARQMDTNDKQR
jgi:hypothetical protein